MLNLESLDDPVLSDACAGFLAGQVSFGPPDQVPINAARELKNVDIQDGTATTRRGTSLLGTALAGAIQGLFWYDTPSFEYLVAVENALTKKFDEVSWSAVSGYVPASTTAQVQIAQLIDKIYFADGTSHLYEWDNATLADLGATPGSPAGDPPIGSIIISAHNRIWMAGIAAVPDTLARSALLDATSWDSTNQLIRIGGGEGDPITGLAELDEQQVVVFKRNSLYIVTAPPAGTSGTTTADNFGVATITKLSGTIGCVSHRSIARGPRDVYFLSDGGVYSLGRVESQLAREIDNAPMSLPVQDVIDRINWSAANTAAGFFWNNRYLLALPLDDATSPNYVLVYSTLRNAWSGLWTWGALCWAISKASGNERLNFGLSTGAVWRWLDYIPKSNEVETTFQDAGAYIETRVVGRAMLFGDADSRKSPLAVEAQFFSSQARASIGLKLDETDERRLSDSFTTAAGELLLPFTLPATLPSDGIRYIPFGCQHLGQFRTLAPVVVAPQDKLALRGVLAKAFGDTISLGNES